MKYLALAALVFVMMAQPALAHEHEGNDKDAWFQKMDKDGDGKVTKSEHDAFGDMMFKEADANNDNALTMDEMKAAHKNMKHDHDDKHDDKK